MELKQKRFHDLVLDHERLGEVEMMRKQNPWSRKDTQRWGSQGVVWEAHGCRRKQTWRGVESRSTLRAGIRTCLVLHWGPWGQFLQGLVKAGLHDHFSCSELKKKIYFRRQSCSAFNWGVKLLTEVWSCLLGLNLEHKVFQTFIGAGSFNSRKISRFILKGVVLSMDGGPLQILLRRILRLHLGIVGRNAVINWQCLLWIQRKEGSCLFSTTDVIWKQNYRI